MHSIPHVYVYCRVSSLKQVLSGNGLETQAQRCVAKVNEWGYHLVDIYREEAKSGAAINRPLIEQMFSDIAKFRKKDKHTEIIVLFDEISRFARDTELLLNLKRRIEVDLKARVEFASYEIQNSPEGRMMLTVQAAMVTWERENNTKRVIQRMRGCYDRDVYIYGRAKMGYYYGSMGAVPGQIQIPHPTNSRVIAEALKLYAAGSMTSVKQVKEYLDQRKITYEEGRYKDQVRTNSLDSVKKMLGNAFFYAGFMRDPKNQHLLKKGKHQAIISVEVYEAIQERLGKRKSTYQKASAEEYPLKGWIRCGECGHLMTSNGQGSRGRNLKRYLYYQCRNGSCKLWKKSIPTQSVHSEFEQLLSRFRCPDELLLNCEKTVINLWQKKLSDMKMDVASYRVRLKEVGFEIERCAKTLVAATEKVVIDSVTKLMAELSTEKAKLEERIKQESRGSQEMEMLVWRLNWLLSAPEVLWKKASIIDKKTMLNLLFPDKWVYETSGNFRKLGDPLESAVINAFGEGKEELVVRNGITSNRFCQFIDSLNGLGKAIEAAPKLDGNSFVWEPLLKVA